MLAAACRQAPNPNGAVSGPAPSTAPAIFEDVSAETGLAFEHCNDAAGNYYFPEIMGGGVALADVDNDGDLDVYLVQGQRWPGGQAGESLCPEVSDARLRDRLWRNDLEILPDGSRTLRFTDVTESSGLDARGYGMGVAAGDYNGDGWVDFYVTNAGGNQLWRNDGHRGDGPVSFTDVTAETGTGDELWSTSAAFVDLDQDGWLDLYVANYVNFRSGTHKKCRLPTGQVDYCGPMSYDAEPDRLLRNLGPEGGHRFEDVSADSGILAEYGAGLGVVSADFDGDGRLDLYVANDQMPNFLWVNAGDGDRLAFANEAAFSGTAVNMEGKSEASMGVEVGDVDNDGDADLFLTHLQGETNTLYLNDGSGLFTDRTRSSRLGGTSVASTGFGTALLDYDNDGWLDVVAVNGGVRMIEELALAGDPYPYHQPNQLFHNLGGGRFADTSAEAGPVFALSEVSRGTAVGDLDNDGDPDLVITNNAGPARVLRNEVGRHRHWLGLRLASGTPPRTSLGARVRVERGDGVVIWRRARRGGSYCSSRDPRVLVGLGEAAGVERVRVIWPRGRVEEWTGLPIDRYSTLVEGSGTPYAGTPAAGDDP